MWNCPTKNLPGCMARERLHLVRLRMIDRELHLGLFGMLLECQEREQLPRVIAEQKILLHHRSSNCNCHVQDLSLFKTTKAADPNHMERWTRKSFLLRVCVHPQFNLLINNFRGTPHFFPDRTEQKQRRHLEITAIVNFPVLFLSVYCLLLTISMFCFLINHDLI